MGMGEGWLLLVIWLNDGRRERQMDDDDDSFLAMVLLF